jgi:hypothetical protein
MSQYFAPQRRKLLALQNETPPPAGLIVHPQSGRPVEPGRQTALSIPEAVRALGEPLSPFFEACGGRQAISLAVRWTGSKSPPETYVFRQPFVLVGRCRESDLALPDREVKFRQLYLQLVAGRWMFVDLGRIGGKAHAGKGGKYSGWFDCGDELAAGPYTIAHVGSQANEMPHREDALMRGSGPLPVVDLEFVSTYSNPGAVQSWRIPGAVTLVGAGRRCDLWLDDESVSNVHASLVLAGKGLWVVDLLGRGGVRVDDRPIYWKQLYHGSHLQIGRYRFRVRFDAPQGQALRPIGDRPAADSLALSESAVSTSVGLTDQTVMALIHHMSEMQERFFEHSQQQSKLMAEMLAQLGRGAQAAVREDMARIDQISREMEQLKAQIAAQAAATSPPGNAAFGGVPQRRPAVPAPPRQVVPEISSGPATARTDPLPASTAAQARLTERMAQLAESRNSAWRRVLDAFSRRGP